MGRSASAPGSRLIERLGYPPYFLVILGIWKLLGAVALVVPRFPRLKEWAYAGVLFDLTGAVASLLASGGSEAGSLAYPIAMIGVALASWALRPPSRRLGEWPTRIEAATGHLSAPKYRAESSDSA